MASCWDLAGSHLGDRQHHKTWFSPASQSFYQGLVFSPVSWQRLNTPSMLRSCSSLVFPKNYDVVCNSCHSFVPFICFVNFGLKDVLWHFSAKRASRWICVYQKGSWMWWGNLSRTTFQYSHLASTMEKTVAPLNLGKISSRVGVTWCSLWIAALTSLGTRQSLNLPFCFRRLTRLLTQAFCLPKKYGEEHSLFAYNWGTLWPSLRQFGRQYHAFASVWRYKRHFPEIEEGIHWYRTP